MPAHLEERLGSSRPVPVPPRVCPVCVPVREWPRLRAVPHHLLVTRRPLQRLARRRSELLGAGLHCVFPRGGSTAQLAAEDGRGRETERADGATQRGGGVQNRVGVHDLSGTERRPSGFRMQQGLLASVGMPTCGGRSLGKNTPNDKSSKRAHLSPAERTSHSQRC